MSAKTLEKSYEVIRCKDREWAGLIGPQPIVVSVNRGYLVPLPLR